MELEIPKSIIILIAVVILVSIFALGYLAIGPNSDGSEPGAEVAGISQSIRTVNVEEFEDELEEDGSIVMDIRTPQEFAAGHIAEAINVDFYAPDFEQQLAEMDRNASYKIYCNSGNRSSSAMRTMRDMGFTNVVELGGGITAWNIGSKDTCVNC